MTVEERSDGAVARLRRLVGRLGGLGADGEWLALVLELYLAPGVAAGFEGYAGISPTARAAYWRRVRDAALVQLGAALAPGASAAGQAAAVREALIRYASTRWARMDCYWKAAPAAYDCAIEAHLSAALGAGRGHVPAARSVRRILEVEGLAKNPQAMANALGHTAGEIRREKNAQPLP